MAFAVIPARYQSSRLKEKVLLPIAGKPLVWHVYKNSLEVDGIEGCVVATDSEIVKNAMCELDIPCLMTSEEHSSGTERVAEASIQIEDRVIINIQADEPLINKEALSLLVRCFDDEGVEIATLKREASKEEFINENAVKVVCDKDNNAMYFSRAPIPHTRGGGKPTNSFIHVGVYAYTKDVLQKISTLEKCSIEESEVLEQLRWLYNGFKIKTVFTKERFIGVDTKEDYERVKKIIEEKQL